MGLFGSDKNSHEKVKEKVIYNLVPKLVSSIFDNFVSCFPQLNKKNRSMR